MDVWEMDQKHGSCIGNIPPAHMKRTVKGKVFLKYLNV